jgi:hypothetical protein
VSIDEEIKIELISSLCLNKLKKENPVEKNHFYELREKHG